MAKTRLLLVEDDQDLREALVTTLEMAHYQIIEADCGEQALVLLSQQPVDLVVSDVNMPGISGHELLASIQQHYPGTPVVLMTAYGEIQHAVAAMQAGAVDYLVKPFSPQTLNGVLKKVLGLCSGVDSDAPICEVPGSRRIFQLADKVADSDFTVLLCGESGTGKEVLARYIHQHSSRADKPFVAINCAAIPENMLEAILFGHEKGAFTGAHAASPGKFEQANGGTLLLDEISEMEPGLQAKLLRVLQEKEVERVGGRRTIKLDVRVLATTNRDLREHVTRGNFREDLYYRLSVFPLQWMPLRERPGDILPLAQHLLKKHTRKMKLRGLSLDDSAQRALLNHPWPGNVRELDNAIQRSLILQQGNRITAADLSLEQAGAGGMGQAMALSQVAAGPGLHPVTPQDLPQETVDPERPDDASLGHDLRQREYQIIIDTLRNERGRRKQAAERLGISPRTLRYKLAQIRDSGIDLDQALAS
ncbi:MAG: sigma-54-dependent Fis family transcriptional regulator [Halomonadaceae bacterium]|nr:MAG: sigma-54-dependent Fis family transcriptional regulator [Halomonadaceae bacterium]